jgi:iron complex transport system ATP-binding protein
MVRSFQDCRLYPELSVFDVLMLCEDVKQEVAVLPTTLQLPWARRAEKRKQAAVDQVIGAFGLERFRHHRTAELSTGTRRVVDLASVILAEPRLLLLDEPTQNLDIGRQVELIDLLHFLRDQGITILASMHDLHLVDKNFSTVLLLSPGQPLASGSPEQMLKPSILEHAFQCPPDRHPLLIERAELYRREAR